MIEGMRRTEEMLRFETSYGVPRHVCAHCGATVLPGQPHSALAPFPHQTVGALIARDSLAEADAADGSHAEVEHDGSCCHSCDPLTIGRKRVGVTIGRIVTGDLVQGPDGLWREVKA